LLRQIRTLETKISFISSDQAVLFTPHGITSDATNEQYILMPLIDDSAI
jgi:hypothetical protein